jgi:uncharacterized protein YeaO (DUF488 family)
MSFISKSNLQLVSFLRNLADSIEKEELLPEQVQKIGEFYMSYEKEIYDSGDNSTEDSMDVVKFLTLGWYMYTHLLKNENTDESEVD